MISELEKQILLRFQSSFTDYAQICLKIRSKAGSVAPFILNSGQQFIHDKAEAQRRATGRIRAIVLKGRQIGCSTYIEGRFYWRVTRQRGYRAFILTHENEATSNLFEMAQRYHDNCPDEFKPHTGASNANELIFDLLDSGYKIGTAGNKAVGRSSTIQLFHGSEVAYWPNAEQHAAGILQAVPSEPGTEVWLESTANGENDYFHQQWRMAVSGESDFIPIFIPWFWQHEYRADPPEGFSVAADERDLIGQFNLNEAQLAWRRKKIVELGGSDMGLDRFRHEYPNTPEEAFASSQDKKLIPSTIVRAAINRNVALIEKWKPIWGVDVAWMGKDRTTLAKRQANYLLEPIKWWNGKDPMQVVGLVKAEWDATPTDEKPAQILVDVIGIGAGVVARLREIGLPVIGVNVSETKGISDANNRLKDELWWKAKLWFDGLDVCLPEGESTELLVQELSSPTYEHTSAGKLILESKDSLAKRGIRSTDLADAFVLTFHGALIENEIEQRDRYRRRRTSGGSWMSV